MDGQLTIDGAVERRNAILTLVTLDPRSSDTMRAVADAISRVARPGELVSANDIRPHLPAWVRTFAIGPTFGALVKRGALARVGYVPSTDEGTHGKPVAVYRVIEDVTT